MQGTIKVFEPGVREVHFTGDIHGIFPALTSHGYTDSAIVVCGDIGMGFFRLGAYEKVFRRLNAWAEITRNHFFLVRGNHDEPSWFAEGWPGEGRVLCVPDYSVIKAAGHAVLCVGGGVSLDRNGRLLMGKHGRRCYWKDEVPFYDADLVAEAAGHGIDIVASHIAPMQAPPAMEEGLSEWSVGDYRLPLDVKEARKVMSSVLEGLKDVKVWYHGHYHRHNDTVVDGVRFVTLDMCRDGKIDII